MRVGACPSAFGRHSSFCLPTLGAWLLACGFAVRGLRLIATLRRGARDLRCLHGKDCAARKVRASASEEVVKDGGGYGHPQTHGPVFSEGQEDYRTIGTDSLEPFEPLRGGASGGPKEPVPIIAVIELIERN